MSNFLTVVTWVAIIALAGLLVKRLASSGKVREFRELLDKARELREADTETNEGVKTDNGKDSESDNEVKDAKEGVKTDDGKDSESDDNTKEGAKLAVSGIANELAAVISSLDGKEVDLAEAIAKAIAEEKAEAERRAKAKRKAFEDEVAKASASIAGVLNTPLTQFQPVKTATRQVARIKKEGNDNDND